MQNRETESKIIKLNQALEEEENICKELERNEEEYFKTKNELEIEEKNEISENKHLFETNKKKQKFRDGLQKDIRKIEKEIVEIDDQIKQYTTEYNTTQKNFEVLKGDLARQDAIKEDLEDEIKLFTDKNANKSKLIEKINDTLKKYKKELDQYEVELVSHKKDEVINSENIRKLTIIKERMARTASQATQQAKERKEELKILGISN